MIIHIYAKVSLSINLGDYKPDTLRFISKNGINAPNLTPTDLRNFQVNEKWILDYSHLCKGLTGII
ncbi:hypothetical protein THERMOT_341 [Bathymodiolus thermophilus thioautotrophic gill symbiont]|nr:hypothetical protein THERMOT_341 [Bathymodiolus thermophilus thioautotrophic gill symbiont]